MARELLLYRPGKRKGLWWQELRFTILMNAKSDKPPRSWEWGEDKENLDLEKRWIDLPHKERRETEDEKRKDFPEWRRR